MVVPFDVHDETAWSIRFLQGVMVGDIIPVTLRHGGIQIEGDDYRISSITLHRDRSLTVVAEWLSTDVAWIGDHPWVPHVN
jgi:hypothetical protein